MTVKQQREPDGTFSSPAIAGEARLPDAAATARRQRSIKAVTKALLSDLGGDPSKAQQILAHNAAAAAAICNDRIEEYAAGAPVNLAELSTFQNSLRRLLETLGIERKPRDVTKLAEYLEAKRQPVTINGSATQ